MRLLVIGPLERHNARAEFERVEAALAACEYEVVSAAELSRADQVAALFAVDGVACLEGFAMEVWPESLQEIARFGLRKKTWSWREWVKNFNGKWPR